MRRKAQPRWSRRAAEYTFGARDRIQGVKEKVGIDLRPQRLQFGLTGVQQKVALAPLLPQPFLAKAEILKGQAKRFRQ